MLKKIRWKFISISMFSIFLVILIIVVCINLMNYIVATKNQDIIINDIIKQNTPSNFNQNPPMIKFSHEFSPEIKYMTRFFIVVCDNQNVPINVYCEFISSINTDEAKLYAQKVLSKNKNKGYYIEYRYLIKPINDNKKIVIFLLSSNELRMMKSFLITSSIVAFFSLLLVFILVTVLSKRVINPYIRNMERQKQFITDASHEIKTPLTSISTSADVLSMEYENNEWILNIQKQSLKLSKLVENLITLSRLDEETPFPNKAKFSISEAIWEILEPFSSLAKAKNKSYSQNIEDNLYFIGDKTSIQQMVSILLDNAIKYSDTNGNIQLNLYKKHSKIIIEVSNTCKLSNKIDGRIFDRFYRPDKSRSKNTGGYGIGLSIVKSIVQNHNGKVSVETTNDTLIKFKVIL